MDTAYNIYGNNTMGIGLANAGLDNTVQTSQNELANNVIEIANRIGINMVDRDVERSFGGDARNSRTKKAKFTPSSKSKIGLKYLDYVKNNRQDSVKQVSNDVVGIGEYQNPVATENESLASPSVTCQNLSERIVPKTKQLEKVVTLHANVIGMDKNLFANSCKPIKVNSRSIANCLSNREVLERYFGKPVENIQAERNDSIDVSSIDNRGIGESVNDAFTMSSLPLNDTIQMPAMGLNNNIEKPVDNITEPSGNILSDIEMQQTMELPEKKRNATSEYNVDSLFKKDVDITKFQMPPVDSLKTDSMDSTDKDLYNMEKDEKMRASEKRLNDYIDATSSQDSLAQLRNAITNEAKRTANLQQVVGTQRAEIIDLEKEKEELNRKKQEIAKKAKERYQSFVKTNETLDRTRQEMKESLQKTRTDISDIMSQIEAYESMLDVKVPDASANKGRRGKAA